MCAQMSLSASASASWVTQETEPFHAASTLGGHASVLNSADGTYCQRQHLEISKSTTEGISRGRAYLTPDSRVPDTCHELKYAGNSKPFLFVLGASPKSDDSFNVATWIEEESLKAQLAEHNVVLTTMSDPDEAGKVRVYVYGREESSTSVAMSLMCDFTAMAH